MPDGTENHWISSAISPIDLASSSRSSGSAANSASRLRRSMALMIMVSEPGLMCFGHYLRRRAKSIRPRSPLELGRGLIILPIRGPQVGNMSRARSTVVEGEALTARVPLLTLPQLVRRNARRYGEKTAIVDAPTERRYSYAELDRLIGRFAAGLAARGFRSGDVLLLYTPNQPEWLIAALGAMSMGGVVSGANSQYGAAELEHQLREVRARFVLTTSALLPTVQGAIAKLSGLTVLLADEAPGTVSFASIIASTAPEPAAPGHTKPDPAASGIGAPETGSPP